MSDETMSARDVIMQRLKEKKSPQEGAYPLPPVVTLGDQDASSERFEASLALMGGKMLPLQEGEEIEQAIKRVFPEMRNLCTAVPEVKGTLRIEELETHEQADTVDVMVVRAAFGVAETGGIFLSEVELKDHLADVHLAQHLVVLLSKDELVGNMHNAYQERSEFRTAGYGVLMSGPSATADIQGVLIRGAQGVRSLSVIWA